MRKIELLCPASSLEVLKIAVIYGADAVYIGGEAFGLRAKAKNFSMEEMAEGVAFAHAHGVRVYVTANILAHNYDLDGVREYFTELHNMKPDRPDALIIADPAVFMIAKEVCPEIERHVSTQANNTNYGTYQFWWNLGASRVVTARELSLKEIKEIRGHIDDRMEIETFVHGAMCISYSGRCLLSNYFTGRDANKGACTHPCRWKYSVVEEKRPGEYLPVYENERGTYASNLSALWIILANGWMQNPVGYVIKNGRAELSSFFDVVTNPFAWSQYFHTIFAAWMLGGFFVLGVSSWHLLRKNELDLFKRSVRIAAPFTLILVLLLGLQGHHHAQIVAEMQPAKLAAMESHWETGTHVPMYLLTWPDQANRTNSIQALPIPSLLSLLAFNSPSAEVKGLDAFPADDIPPVLPTFLSFRFMVACAGLFVLLAIAAWWWRKDLENHPLLMKALIYVIPLPYLGIMAGWAVAEIGRQPWIVYGLMRTSDAVSPVPTSSVGLSLAAFIVIYTFLGILDIYLLRKYAKKGPEAAPEAQA